MDFAIFDPRVFFSVFTLTLHAYIYKRVFNPSPFTFLLNILWVSELRVKGGEGRSKKTFHFSMKKTALKIWKLQIFSVSLQKKIKT